MKKSYVQEQHLIAAFLNLVLEKNDDYLSQLSEEHPSIEQAKIIEKVCSKVLDKLYNIKEIRNKTYLSDLSDLINKNVLSYSNKKKSQYLLSLLILKSLLIDINADSDEAKKIMQSFEIIINRENAHYPVSLVNQLKQKLKSIVRHNYQVIKK